MPHLTRPPYHGPIRGIIVDLAGTTVDFGSCAPAGCFVELFANEGVPLTLDQARRPMGLNKRDHILALLQMPEVAQGWLSSHGAAPTEADVTRLYHDFIPLQIAVLPPYSRLIPGVLDTLQVWRERGWAVAATTGYNRAMMEVVLREAKAQGFSPEIAVCADDVPLGRPAPWLIYQAMMRLQVYPLESVVVIGDTLADVQAGLTAGVWTIGLAATGNLLGLSEEDFNALSPQDREARLLRARRSLEEAGAHFVADRLADCTPWIDSLWP